VTSVEVQDELAAHAQRAKVIHEPVLSLKYTYLAGRVGQASPISPFARVMEQLVERVMTLAFPIRSLVVKIEALLLVLEPLSSILALILSISSLAMPQA